MYDQVEDHADEYRVARREDAERALEPLAGQAGELLERWLAAQAALALDRCARDWHNNPNSAALSSGLGHVDKTRKQFHKQLDRARLLHRSAPVERDVVALTAALVVELEREAGSE